MTQVKFCKDCKWSHPSDMLVCKHPVVNMHDCYSLGGTKINGTECIHERSKTWFAKCGIKGKLWEAKQ